MAILKYVMLYDHMMINHMIENHIYHNICLWLMTNIFERLDNINGGLVLGKRLGGTLRGKVKNIIDTAASGRPVVEGIVTRARVCRDFVKKETVCKISPEIYEKYYL